MTRTECSCWEEKIDAHCPWHGAEARGVDVPCSAGAINRALAEARAESAIVGLTLAQIDDLFAISDRWNADRAKRGLRALSENEILTAALSTLRGLICGKDG